MMTLVALGVAACGSGDTSAGSGAGGSSGYNQDVNVNANGTPARGGTLRVIGNADVDHLDTASAY